MSLNVDFANVRQVKFFDTQKIAEGGDRLKYAAAQSERARG